jgi:hypothetical protein
MFSKINWIRSGIIFLTDVLDEYGLNEGQIMHTLSCIHNKLYVSLLLI